MSREINPFGLRMPADLKAQLEDAAHNSRRSLNAEIVARLQESFAPSEPLTINLIAEEETKMKDIQAVLELLKPGIKADQTINFVVAQVQKG